jgi:site-specific DNA-methyltransferase (adenine-specific)
MSAIVREVTIGNCRIIQGDCKEVLPEIGGVDHIITDPPFSARTHDGFDSTSARKKLDGSVRKSLGYGSITTAEAMEMADLFCNASAGWVLWFTDHALAPIIHGAMEANSRATFAPLPFFHPGRSCRLSGDGPSSWTDWIVCSRTKALHKWGTLPGGYVAGEGWRDKNHMGGKPLKLMLQVVSDYSRPGDLVCDPCLGGGTTLVACVQTGRRGVGIELDPATFEKAVKRITDAHRQADLFVAKPAYVAPVQEGLL